ncbi:hypothetical protein POVWA2_088550 [Plasmodium ovale wallikeri]|uniref:Uncharacterized protein n=1 Tax=Plasmodium ovale wallikeri TaxID=864142 RepID=A0A1A9ARR2_PLAOA|nr:hypothetical protein POVWA1_071820 [Plasmodium ovale wallikeri]SBT58856.1 hypothetical protein POVWA2_088550 [Plasmodium ovale wallikeri]
MSTSDLPTLSDTFSSTRAPKISHSDPIQTTVSSTIPAIETTNCDINLITSITTGGYQGTKLSNDILQNFNPKVTTEESPLLSNII